MHMVGHQHVGVDANRLGRRAVSQHAKEHAVICVVVEDRGPVDAAEDDVHREPGCDNAGVSGHADLCSLKD
jgi:hypothetical protein